MKTHDCITQNDSFLYQYDQSLHLKLKDRFAWVILSYVILGALDVTNISCLQLWEGTDIAF